MIKPLRSFTVATTGFFLVIALSSVPSDPAVLPPKTLDVEELEMLEELSSWLTEDVETEFVSEVGSVAAALRARRDSFEVFRRYNEADSRREILDRIPFAGLIGEAAERYGLDPLLLAAVVAAESSFEPTAISVDGAVGLAQILPQTADKELEELLDPQVNLLAGARYLRWLLDRFEGDLELALAAYNAGPGKVSRFGGVPPYRETRNYVERVLSIYVGHHQDVWHQSDAADLLILR